MTLTETVMARIRALAQRPLLLRAGGIALLLGTLVSLARTGDHGGPALDKEACLRCHEPLREVVARPFPHKPAADGECVRCHSPHAARFDKLLNLRERALCASCHSEEITEFMTGSVHTPIKEGKCTGCHEVHGSENEALLARSGNELCLGCHEAKQAQTSWPVQHDPFATGECLDCHSPHNSAVPSLLVAPALNLCQLCHSPESPELTEAHQGIPVAGTQCTSCHEPHASASNGLLRSVLHPPFEEKSCDMCHMTDSDTPRLVRATGGRLCAPCHQDYPKSKDPVVHKPAAEGNCGACHLPHAGNVRRLLADQPQALCTKCHAEVAARAAESRSSHPLDPERGACLACHAPHSSTEPHLLVSGEIRTCLGCHETQRHGHPLGEDRLDPRTNKPITCVTCHDPHGTKFAYMLRGDQSRGLCLECHADDGSIGGGDGH